jgi:hypothetical protein
VIVVVEEYHVPRWDQSSGLVGLGDRLSRHDWFYLRTG